jgi:methyl-accepting chemotaxis protein
LQPPLTQLERLADATAQVATRSQDQNGVGLEAESSIDTVAGINQLIIQVADVASSASLLAETARKAAAAAPPDDPAFAQLTSNLRGLDAEAKQMSEQLHTVTEALQATLARMAESTGNLDRTAEDLRQAIEQFRFQLDS